MSDFVSVRMFEWQKKFVESKSNNIILNWCRNSGKEYALATKILKEKPECVLVYNQAGLRSLGDKIDELVKNYYLKAVSKLLINSDSITIIINNKLIEIISKQDRTHGMYPLHVNWKVFHEELPYFDKIQCDKTISILSTNNYDFKLQRLCPYSEIIQVDISNNEIKNILGNKIIEKLTNSVDPIVYFNEYALLSKPCEDIISYPQPRKELLFDSIEVNTGNLFLVDSLADLQEEYDKILKNKDTILTRKNLMEMILQLEEKLGLI